MLHSKTLKGAGLTAACLLAAFRAIACGPAIANEAHCYTMGAAQMIVPDLFDKNEGAIKLGLTAKRVELGDEFPDEPETCYVEITTNTGLLMKYKFRYDGATGSATLDLIGAGAQ